MEAYIQLAAVEMEGKGPNADHWKKNMLEDLHTGIEVGKWTRGY